MTKMGRPKIEIDFKLVEQLARIHCTQEEIATFMGFSLRTLTSNPEFLPIYEKAREEGKMSLRRLQWKKAQEGNTTMMIWLGKQYLGQKDKQEIEHSGNIGKAEDLSDEELERIVLNRRSRGATEEKESS